MLRNRYGLRGLYRQRPAWGPTTRRKPGERLRTDRIEFVSSVRELPERRSGEVWRMQGFRAGRRGAASGGTVTSRRETPAGPLEDVHEDPN